MPFQPLHEGRRHRTVPRGRACNRRPSRLPPFNGAQLETAQPDERDGSQWSCPEHVGDQGKRTPTARPRSYSCGASDRATAIPASSLVSGLYVDDVYRGLLLGTDLDLTDIDRRRGCCGGPQGTLSGKRILWGGSLKPVLEEGPATRPTVYVEATYGKIQSLSSFAAGGKLHAGSRHSLRACLRRLEAGRRIHGNVSTMRAPIRAHRRVKHPGPGSTRLQSLGTEGGEDVNAIRVALRWIASDSIEDNFIADATRRPARKYPH